MWIFAILGVYVLMSVSVEDAPAGPARGAVKAAQDRLWPLVRRPSLFE